MGSQLDLEVRGKTESWASVFHLFGGSFKLLKTLTSDHFEAQVSKNKSTRLFTSNIPNPH